MEFTDKVDMVEVLDEFENCPVQVIYFRVQIPCFLKMPLDLVISITPSVLSDLPESYI